MKIKKWHLWLGVAISVVFLYLAFRKVDFGQVWQYFKTAQWGWVVLGLGFYFMGVWLRAIRWQVLLNPVKHLNATRLFPVVAIGYMGNNVYPARAGEVLRSVLLKQKEDIDISASLATIVVERLFDAIVILGFVLLNIGQLGKLNAAQGMLSGIQRGAVVGGVVFGLILLVFLAMVFFPMHTQRFFGWFIDHLLPTKIRPTIKGILKRFIDGLSSLKSPVESIKVLVLTMLIWTLETGLYWGVMKALGIDLSFISLMLINGVVNLVLLIPAAPGGLGTFDAASKAMLELFGVGTNLASGFTLLLRVALWVPITLLGAIYFVKEGLSLSTDIETIQASYQAQETGSAATDHKDEEETA
ncbi:MAG: lysylphosphatidylglycerol synthase transmembrane domain-containing protein [Anaerolineaceae bacterium]